MEEASLYWKGRVDGLEDTLGPYAPDRIAMGFILTYDSDGEPHLLIPMADSRQLEDRILRGVSRTAYTGEGPQKPWSGYRLTGRKEDPAANEKEPQPGGEVLEPQKSLSFEDIELETFFDSMDPDSDDVLRRFRRAGVFVATLLPQSLEDAPRYKKCGQPLGLSKANVRPPLQEIWNH